MRGIEDSLRGVFRDGFYDLFLGYRAIYLANRLESSLVRMYFS